MKCARFRKVGISDIIHFIAEEEGRKRRQGSLTEGSSWYTFKKKLSVSG